MVIERARAVADFELNEESRQLFSEVFLAGRDLSVSAVDGTMLEEMLPFEKGLEGLQDYY